MNEKVVKTEDSEHGPLLNIGPSIEKFLSEESDL
jgi:hypothetical protein